MINHLLPLLKSNPNQAAEAQCLQHLESLSQARLARQEIEAQSLQQKEDAKLRECASSAALAAAERAAEAIILDLRRRLGASEVEVQCHVAEVAVLRGEMDKLTASIEQSRARGEERLCAAEAEAKSREEVMARMVEEQQEQSAEQAYELTLLHEKGLVAAAAHAACSQQLQSCQSELQSTDERAAALEATLAAHRHDLSSAHTRHCRALEAALAEKTAAEADAACLRVIVDGLQHRAGLAENFSSTQAAALADLRGSVAAAGRRLQLDCSSLRLDLAASHDVVQALGQHNAKLAEAFAQAELEKLAAPKEHAATRIELMAANKSLAELAGQLCALEAALHRSQADARDAAAALHAADERYHALLSEQADATAQISKLQQRSTAAESAQASASAQLEAASQLALQHQAVIVTHAAEMQMLRCYCEEQRILSLALQDQHAQAALESVKLQAAASGLSEDLCQVQACLACSEHEAEQREAAHSSALAALTTTHAKQYAALSEQMNATQATLQASEAGRLAAIQEATATKAQSEALLAEESDRHVAALESFRSERARILSSYEHMLEESEVWIFTTGLP